MADDSLLRIGARIQATSNDERYPPRSVIDGRADTFWATGGTYPQQFTITFPSMVTIKSVTIYCYKVRDLMLEKSTKQIPIKFEAVAEKELERREHELNVELLVNGEFAAHHLRFTIRAAYDHFCSVHKVTLGGVTPAERGAVLEEQASSSGNLLSVGSSGDAATKLSPRHPRSAMRRRRESLAQNGSPIKLLPDDDSDDEDEKFGKPLQSVTSVSRYGAEEGVNVIAGNNQARLATDDVMNIKDDDDDEPDLSLG